MAGVIDRVRAAAPPATGIASVADAWACTNPTLGRGIALGLAHAALLRDVLREPGSTTRRAFAEAWRERDRARAGAVVPGCLVVADRVRLAEMDAHRRRPRARAAGRPRPPCCARRCSPRCRTTPTSYRAGLEIIGCLAHAEDVFARPGFAEHVVAHRGRGSTARRRWGPGATSCCGWSRERASVDSGADAPPGHVLAQRHALAVADVRVALQVLRVRDAPAAPARARRGRAAARRRRAAQRQGAAGADRRRARRITPACASGSRRSASTDFVGLRRVVLRARARARAAAAHEPRRARPRRPRAAARGDREPGADARVAAARPRRPPGARRRRIRRCGSARCAPPRS